jgi:hypothetical protein
MLMAVTFQSFFGIVLMGVGLLPQTFGWQTVCTLNLAASLASAC